ncbi:MAG: hypothetical protein HWE25_11035 [Alphaproteobacteria bacterium]|nr:hypothetical protein [Alphaproteobacteria bacterium]
MIQNVAGGLPPVSRTATSSDRQDLRWNGAEGRGFAFGKLRREPIVDKVDIPSSEASTPASVAVAGTQASLYSNTSSADVSNPQVSNTPLPNTDVSNGDTGVTNAVAVTKEGSVNINVSINQGDGNGGKGVVHFEEGGNYSFALSGHPGAKYRIVGVEGGQGVSNPNNIKGTIFLNGAEIALGDVKDKIGDFLKKRDEIAAKGADRPEKAQKAGAITLDDLKAFGLLATPDVGVLNIHDDRFDRSKFTDKEVLSLKVAAKLSVQESVNPTREEYGGKGNGLKVGHQKEGLGAYGNGLKLGHAHAHGILGHYV